MGFPRLWLAIKYFIGFEQPCNYLERITHFVRERAKLKYRVVFARQNNEQALLFMLWFMND